jgi:hypothetical protein
MMRTPKLSRIFLATAASLVATASAFAYPALDASALKNCPAETRAVLTTTDGAGGIKLFEMNCYNQAGEAVRRIMTKQSDGALVAVSEAASLEGPVFKAYLQFYREASAPEKARLPAPSRDQLLYQSFDNGKASELLVGKSLDGRLSQSEWSDVAFDSKGRNLEVQKYFREWEKECVSSALPNGLENKSCNGTMSVVIRPNGEKFWPVSKDASCTDPKTKKSLRLQYVESSDGKAIVLLYGNDGQGEKVVLRRSYESADVAHDALFSSWTPGYAAIRAETPLLSILDDCGGIVIGAEDDREKVIAEYRTKIEKAKTDLNALTATTTVLAGTSDAPGAKTTRKPAATPNLTPPAGTNSNVE